MLAASVPFTTFPLKLIPWGVKSLLPTVPMPKPSVGGIVTGVANDLNCQPWSPGFTAIRFEGSVELPVSICGVQETG